MVLEQLPLFPRRQRKRVETQVAQMVDEFVGPVRAVDLARLDAANRLDQLVEVGVV